MSPPVPFIPCDPPKPGWRRHPTTGQEFFQLYWLALDNGETEVPELRPDGISSSSAFVSKPEPGPTPEQQEAWARQIAADSCERAAKNLRKLLDEHSPEDAERLAELHRLVADVALTVRDSVPPILRLVG